MRKTGGAILVLEARHLFAFDERVERDFDFTTAVDRAAPLGALQPCVVVDRDNSLVVAVGRLVRGRITTATDRVVRLTRIRRVGPWSLESLAGSLPESARNRLLGQKETGALPPGVWNALAAVIRERNPDIAGVLDTVTEQLRSRRVTAREEERDAVLLCFEFAGMARPAAELPISDSGHFLEGAEAAAYLEGEIVANDTLAGLPGWVRATDRPHALRFQDEQGRSLTVMNVGGAGPEHALGVDLIYWREAPNAFVMVQYKRLTYQGDALIYRPDRQFAKERERMRTVAQEISALPEEGGPDAFRLSTNAFYFKFCPPVQPNYKPGDLMSGRYVPLDLWDSLSASGGLAGQRGGVTFGRSESSRWMSNSLFSELVAGAWVGTAGKASALVAALVRGSLDQGKWVVIGIEHPQKRASSMATTSGRS